MQKFSIGKSESKPLSQQTPKSKKSPHKRKKEGFGPWADSKIFKIKRNLVELGIVSQTKPYMRSLKHHGHIICVS